MADAEAEDSFSQIALDTPVEAEDSSTETLLADSTEDSEIKTKDEHTVEEIGESETTEETEAKAIETELEHPMVEMVNDGMTNAISGLSGMMCQQIEVTDFGLKKIAVKDVPDLFGGAESMVVGIYLETSGDATGQMIVMYQPEVAYNLIDVLMGQALGTTNSFDEMEVSALGEMGNIIMITMDYIEML